jgi:hypothetical protein
MVLADRGSLSAPGPRVDGAGLRLVGPEYAAAEFGSAGPKAYALEPDPVEINGYR